ncbi:deoxyribose-phosphate aldolase [Candidatus Saccharibacteria bacterium]|nr:deoxyribose-phosphate aldolase [Candidatus Saccharibacteria bacterium]
MILEKTDHTVLTPTAVFEGVGGVKDALRMAIEYGAASMCLAPSFVEEGVEYANGRIPICTVVGFPNGYSVTSAKVAETIIAVEKGAREIDMVINLGHVKARRFDKVQEEISEIRGICGKAVLKVIIETCLLSDEEKVKLCRVVWSAGADFIKTSTGFSTGGATTADVALMKKTIDEMGGCRLQIKASGGINSLDDAKALIGAGAMRLGSSKIISLVRGGGDAGSY